MGSGSTRKSSDKPIIRTPKSSGGKGGSTGRPEMVASLCLLSFEQKVVKTNLTKKGVDVQLSSKNDGYSMKIFGNVIGSLNSRFADMVKKCEELGVHYKGEIVTKEEQVYARFIRVTS